MHSVVVLIISIVLSSNCVDAAAYRAPHEHLSVASPAREGFAVWSELLCACIVLVMPTLFRLASGLASCAKDLVWLCYVTRRLPGIRFRPIVWAIGLCYDALRFITTLITAAYMDAIVPRPTGSRRKGLFVCLQLAMISLGDDQPRSILDALKRGVSRPVLAFSAASLCSRTTVIKPSTGSMAKLPDLARRLELRHPGILWTVHAAMLLRTRLSESPEWRTKYLRWSLSVWAVTSVFGEMIAQLSEPYLAANPWIDDLPLEAKNMLSDLLKLNFDELDWVCQAQGLTGPRRIKFYTYGTKGDSLPVRQWVKACREQGIDAVEVPYCTPEEGLSDLHDIEMGDAWPAIRRCTTNKIKFEAETHHHDVVNVVPASFLGAHGSHVVYGLEPGHHAADPITLGNTKIQTLADVTTGPTRTYDIVGTETGLPRSFSSGKVFRRQHVRLWLWDFGHVKVPSSSVTKCLCSIPTLPPCDHSKYFRYFSNVHCHGGVGTVTTAIEAGASFTAHSNLLDRRWGPEGQRAPVETGRSMSFLLGRLRASHSSCGSLAGKLLEDAECLEESHAYGESIAHRFIASRASVNNACISLVESLKPVQSVAEHRRLVSLLSDAGCLAILASQPQVLTSLGHSRPSQIQCADKYSVFIHLVIHQLAGGIFAALSRDFVPAVLLAIPDSKSMAIGFRRVKPGVPAWHVSLIHPDGSEEGYTECDGTATRYRLAKATEQEWLVGIAGTVELKQPDGPYTSEHNCCTMLFKDLSWTADQAVGRTSVALASIPACTFLLPIYMARVRAFAGIARHVERTVRAAGESLTRDEQRWLRLVFNNQVEKSAEFEDAMLVSEDGDDDDFGHMAELSLCRADLSARAHAVWARSGSNNLRFAVHAFMLTARRAGCGSIIAECVCCRCQALSTRDPLPTKRAARVAALDLQWSFNDIANTELDSYFRGFTVVFGRNLIVRPPPPGAPNGGNYGLFDGQDTHVIVARANGGYRTQIKHDEVPHNEAPLTRGPAWHQTQAAFVRRLTAWISTSIQSIIHVMDYVPGIDQLNYAAFRAKPTWAFQNRALWRADRVTTAYDLAALYNLVDDVGQGSTLRLLAELNSKKPASQPALNQPAARRPIRLAEHDSMSLARVHRAFDMGAEAGANYLEYADPEAILASLRRYHAEPEMEGPGEELLLGAMEEVRRAAPHVFDDNWLAPPRVIANQLVLKYSCGFPFEGQPAVIHGKDVRLRYRRQLRSAGWINGIIEVVKERFSSGYVPTNHHHSFVKCYIERASKLEGGAPIRTVVSQSLVDYFGDMATQYDQNKRMSKMPYDVPWALGMNMSGAGYNEKLKRLPPCERWFAFDFTALDSTFPTWLLDAVSRLRATGFVNHSQSSEIARLLTVQYKALERGEIHDLHTGETILKTRGGSTGSASTSANGTLAVQLALRCAIRLTHPGSGPDLEGWSITNMNDDGIMGMPASADKSAIAAKLLEWGMILKSDPVQEDLLGMEFCKKRIYEGGDYRGDFERASLSIPTYAIVHDAKSILMRQTALMHINSPEYQYARTLGHILLTSHNKDLYSFLREEAIRLRATLAEDPRGRRLIARSRIPSYEKVMRLNYKPVTLIKGFKVTSIWEGYVHAESGFRKKFHDLVDAVDSLGFRHFVGERPFAGTIECMEPPTGMLAEAIAQAGVPACDASEFTSKVAQGPFAAAIDPEREWAMIRSRRKTFDSDGATAVLAGAAVTHILTLKAFQLLSRVPILGLPFATVIGWNLLVQNFYGLTSAIVYASEGRSSGCLSALVPKNPTTLQTRITAFLADYLAPFYVMAGPITVPLVKWLSNGVELVAKRLVASSVIDGPATAAGVSHHDHWGTMVERRIVPAMRKGPVILTAETGTGKSRNVPGALLSHFRLVLVLTPRRVLVRESDWPKLSRGVTMPFQGVHIMTHGHAAARYANGRLPREDDVAYVIDEAHDSSPETLYIITKLKKKGYRLLLMSATSRVVGARLAVSHEIVSSTMPSPFERTIVARHGWDPVRVATQAAKAHDGRILVIVPTIHEVDRIVQDMGARGLTACPMDRSRQPDANSRVVVATQVADAGVNIKGVSVVVDGGRQIYQHEGMLYESDVTLDVAHQRAGRTGRFCDGFVYQCAQPIDFVPLMYPDCDTFLQDQETWSEVCGVEPLQTNADGNAYTCLLPPGVEAPAAAFSGVCRFLLRHTSLVSAMEAASRSDLADTAGDLFERYRGCEKLVTNPAFLHSLKGQRIFRLAGADTPVLWLRLAGGLWHFEESQARLARLPTDSDPRPKPAGTTLLKGLPAPTGEVTMVSSRHFIREFASLCSPSPEALDACKAYWTLHGDNNLSSQDFKDIMDTLAAICEVRFWCSSVASDGYIEAGNRRLGTSRLAAVEARQSCYVLYSWTDSRRRIPIHLTNMPLAGNAGCSLVLRTFMPVKNSMPPMDGKICFRFKPSDIRDLHNRVVHMSGYDIGHLGEGNCGRVCLERALCVSLLEPASGSLADLRAIMPPDTGLIGLSRTSDGRMNADAPNQLSALKRCVILHHVGSHDNGHWVLVGQTKIYGSDETVLGEYQIGWQACEPSARPSVSAVTTLPSYLGCDAMPTCRTPWIGADGQLRTWHREGTLRDAGLTGPVCRLSPASLEVLCRDYATWNRVTVIVVVGPAGNTWKAVPDVSRPSRYGVTVGRTVTWYVSSDYMFMSIGMASNRGSQFRYHYTAPEGLVDSAIERRLIGLSESSDTEDVVLMDAAKHADPSGMTTEVAYRPISFPAKMDMPVDARGTRMYRMSLGIRNLTLFTRDAEVAREVNVLCGALIKLGHGHHLSSTASRPLKEGLVGTVRARIARLVERAKIATRRILDSLDPDDPQFDQWLEELVFDLYPSDIIIGKGGESPATECFNGVSTHGPPSPNHVDFTFTRDFADRIMSSVHELSAYDLGGSRGDCGSRCLNLALGREVACPANATDDELKAAALPSHHLIILSSVGGAVCVDDSEHADRRLPIAIVHHVGTRTRGHWILVGRIKTYLDSKQPWAVAPLVEDHRYYPRPDMETCANHPSLLCDDVRPDCRTPLLEGTGLHSSYLRSGRLPANMPPSEWTVGSINSWTSNARYYAAWNRCSVAVHFKTVELTYRCNPDVSRPAAFEATMGRTLHWFVTSDYKYMAVGMNECRGSQPVPRVYLDKARDNYGLPPDHSAPTLSNTKPDERKHDQGMDASDWSSQASARASRAIRSLPSSLTTRLARHQYTGTLGRARSLLTRMGSRLEGLPSRSDPSYGRIKSAQEKPEVLTVSSRMARALAIIETGSLLTHCERRALREVLGRK